MKDIGNFSVLLFLFMFIYSLLGMELYSYKVVIDEQGLPVEYEGPPSKLKDQTFPSSSFNTLIDAFLTVFIILCNDGWSTIYINYTRACGSIKSSLYFLTLLIFG